MSVDWDEEEETQAYQNMEKTSNSQKPRPYFETKVEVPPNLRTYYGVKSITEYVGQTARYEVEYKINKKARTLSWTATEDMINQFVAPDFIDKGIIDGHKEAFLVLLWEPIKERMDKLYPGHLITNRPPTFNGLRRMKFLEENPEYRKVPPPTPPDDYFEIIGHATNSDDNSLVTIDHRFKTVPEYLSNPGGIGVQGLVYKIFPSYKPVLRAWSHCLWCFAYLDCKKFCPPIKAEEVYDYIPPYGKCPELECQSPNTVKIEEEAVPAFDIDITHPNVPNQRLRICGVRNFAVQKGDIVRARGELQYTDSGIQFRCYGLEVIRIEGERFDL
jgi:hypothetical protein